MIKEEIFSLHKYFIISDFLHNDFHNYIKNNKNREFFIIESSYKMSLWYSTLYVVIEWWQENKLEDKNINNLLLNNLENLEKLRKFRNWTFHYQKKYWNNKITKILNDTNFIKWIENLHSEFSKYFLNYFNVK